MYHVGHLIGRCCDRVPINFLVIYMFTSQCSGYDSPSDSGPVSATLPPLSDARELHATCIAVKILHKQDLSAHLSAFPMACTLCHTDYFWNLNLRK